MTYLVDTNVGIAAMRGHPAVIQRLSPPEPSGCRITTVERHKQGLAEIRQHLTPEGSVLIKGKRTIIGMDSGDKPHAAIKYARKQSDDYRALRFFSADPPGPLHLAFVPSWVSPHPMP